MGVERLVPGALEIAEAVMPGCERRVLDEITHAVPSARSLSESAIAPTTEAVGRMPRPLTAAEEDLRHERLMRLLDDHSVGLPPTELPNQGLGARLWQFGNAGGDVLRERIVGQTTGRWSPELMRSQHWLQQNSSIFSRIPELSKGTFDGPTQMVYQGVSTQFAAAPLGVALRTDNLATCIAVHCQDGATQFLGHVDGMIHHRALTEALDVAGINLNKAEVTLLPGPLPSPALETIMPTFLDNPNAMSRLRVIPFRGPAHGTVIARNGYLFSR